MRVALGGAIGLDFGAVIALGEAMGADTSLLAEVLPDIERTILDAIHGGGEEEDDNG